MEKDLSDYRQSYEKGELRQSNTPENPLELFRDWFLEVEEHYNTGEVNAMTVSTLGLDGYPKSRVVLLKRYNYEGFVFYTNYESEKGKAIEHNPNLCLSFFWAEAERQVIIKGIAEKLPQNLSDGYFESRPQGSQLGAIASDQSSVIPNRAYLEQKLLDLENEYAGKEIKRPNNWGGFLVRPVEIEFWQGRPNRLHDRIRSMLQHDYNWKKERLSP